MVHDGDAVHEPQDHVHVVLDHEHGAADRVQVADDLDEAGHVGRRHAGHGLVEQHDARLGREQHRDLELALVAVGQVARGDLGAAHEPDGLQVPVRLPRRGVAATREAQHRQGAAEAPCAASRTFSRTLRRGNRLDVWKVRPRPARARAATEVVVTSAPSRSTDPLVGRWIPRPG